MQSSYNVIKNTSIKSSGLREIITDAEIEKPLNPEVENNTKVHIESYENLAKTILENARRQGEQIIAKAYEDVRRLEEDALIKAEQIKKAAHETGYMEGYEEGKQEGFNKAYKETIESAMHESENIIANAHDVLNNAKAEYENYMKKKEKEIKELIVTISKSVLKREIEDNGLINKMIFDALENSKNARNFILRCNNMHIDELKNQVDNWKEQLGFFGDIFVLKDNSLEPGNVVIDKGNGKIVVGLDYALQRISEILDGKD